MGSGIAPFSIGPGVSLEKDVQRECMALLAKHPAVAFIHRINTRVLDVADSHKASGTRPFTTAPKGHPDAAGMLKSGKALYIEFKGSSGSLTDEQMAFLSRVNKFGGLGFVARSVEDLLRYLPLRNSQ